jgi:hypothetical protein
VDESETSLLDVPSVAQPSLDLTQMRDAMGAGYSPTQLAFSDRLFGQPDTEEHSSSSRSWSNIGGPDSHIATSAVTPELYIPQVSI